ncbi:hypothetical protein ABVT39_024179 [Epinephelus coioides]
MRQCGSSRCGSRDSPAATPAPSDRTSLKYAANGKIIKVESGRVLFFVSQFPSESEPVEQPSRRSSQALLKRGALPGMPLLKRQPGEVERRAWDCGQQQIRRAALDLTQSPSLEP